MAKKVKSKKSAYETTRSYVIEGIHTMNLKKIERQPRLNYSLCKRKDSDLLGLNRIFRIS